MHNLIVRFYKMIAKAEEWFCVALLVLMTGMCFVQVVNRYLINPYLLHLKDMVYFNDLALYFFVCFMLFSLGAATRCDAHTAVDIFMDRAFGDNPRGRTKYLLFMNSVLLVSLAIFLLPVLNFSKRYLTRRQMSTIVPWFNESWLMIGFSIAMILVVLHIVMKIYMGIHELASGNAAANADDGVMPCPGE